MNVDRSSANTTLARVYGHPSTWSSSLTPIGTPPKGSETSASRRGRARLVRRLVAEGVQPAGGDGREGGVELLQGRALAAAEGLDERAGVPRPRRVAHGRDPNPDLPLRSAPHGLACLPRPPVQPQPVPLVARGGAGPGHPRRVPVRRVRPGRRHLGHGGHERPGVRVGDRAVPGLRPPRRGGRRRRHDRRRGPPDHPGPRRVPRRQPRGPHRQRRARPPSVPAGRPVGAGADRSAPTGGLPAPAAAHVRGRHHRRSPRPAVDQGAGPGRARRHVR